MTKQFDLDEQLKKWVEYLFERIGPEINRLQTDTPMTALVVEALAALKLNDSTMRLEESSRRIEQSSKRLEKWSQALVALTIGLILLTALLIWQAL